MRLRYPRLSQITVLISLALAGAILGVTLGLWESSRQALDRLLDTVGREVWVVQTRPQAGSFSSLPAGGPALSTLADLPGVKRLALEAGGGRSPTEFAYVITGVSEEYFAVRRLALADGRTFGGSSEAVVGYGLRDLLGQEIDVQGRVQQVVGVLTSVQARGGPDWGTDQTVFVPLGAAVTSFVGRLYVETSQEEFHAVGQALEDWLQEQNLTGYQVIHLAERYGLNLRETTARLLGGALGFGVAAVLLAAGANLVAFFLARALERVRALGVRRAVGASRGEVVREEVLGALPWAVAGLFLGLPLASLGGGWLEGVAGVAAQPGPWTLALTFLTLLALVALAALLPALWAARQAPAQAIRGLAASLPQRRLLLAGAGLALGVAGLVLQASASRSAEREVARILGGMGERLGVYSSFLRAGNVFDPRGVPQLMREDYTALLDSPMVMPLSRTAYVEKYSTQLQGPKRTVSILAGAYEGPLPDLVGLRLLAGRWPEGEAREAVVGAALAETLYGEPLPLGESLNLFGRAYTVVGVFLGGEEANLGNVANDQALVSLATLPRPQARARGEILVEVAPGQDVGEALNAASAFLTARHEAPGLAPVHPHRPSELAPAVRDALSELAAVYRLLALALLLLGGAGLAAQMLVSLSLRVREIGIRRAMGASQGTIFRQFLGEGLKLALLAGVAGVLLGVGASYLAARIQEVSFALDLVWLLAAVAIALLVAALFGALPARSASFIPPARAMKEEA